MWRLYTSTWFALIFSFSLFIAVAIFLTHVRSSERLKENTFRVIYEMLERNSEVIDIVGLPFGYPVGATYFPIDLGDNFGARTRIGRFQLSGPKGRCTVIFLVSSKDEVAKLQFLVVYTPEKSIELHCSNQVKPFRQQLYRSVLGTKKADSIVSGSSI